MLGARTQISDKFHNHISYDRSLKYICNTGTAFWYLGEQVCNEVSELSWNRVWQGLAVFIFYLFPDFLCVGSIKRELEYTEVIGHYSKGPRVLLVEVFFFFASDPFG